MANVLVENSYLSDIADAIRLKNGTSNTYTPAQMADAIEAISSASLQSLTITENGTYNPPAGKDGFSQVIANIPNTYSSSDNGKVVDDGILVSQSSLNITANGTYDTTENNQVVVSVTLGLGTKSIVANGTYAASSDNLDGYSSITINVPNSYSASDNGKVVSSGSLVSQTSVTKTANGTYDTTNNNEVVINVPNTYTANDEGFVVDNGELVEQSDLSISSNGTYDTTVIDTVYVNVSSGEFVVDSKNITANGTYLASADDLDGFSSVIINVPNVFSASDEGKVVSSGSLIAQTSTTKTANGTYDTTSNNEVVVNVSPNVGTKTIRANGTYNASSDNLDGYSSVSVQVSGSAVLTSKTITANGTYLPSSEYVDGYDEVIVNVPSSFSASDEGKVVVNGSLVEQVSRLITSSGTYNTIRNNQVVVDIEPTVGTKTITENGTYLASADNYDGYSSVTVNVADSGRCPRSEQETTYIYEYENMSYTSTVESYIPE